MESSKKYTIQAKACIKGESFFESIISDYCIPHHITGPKDIGLDYICEWIHGDNPTGFLFGVQVKTFSIKSCIPKLTNNRYKYNNLEVYSINNPNLKIDLNTLTYWKNFGFPIYLFVVVIDRESNICYYKRYSPYLTKDFNYNEVKFYSSYFKVSDGNKFIAFSDPQNKILGFTRDFYIDFMRCHYSKGNISYINPRKIGLQQFEENNAVFGDLFGEYKEILTLEYLKARTFFENVLKQKT